MWLPDCLLDQQLQKIVIDFDQSSTDIQSCRECSPPCWRALCLCGSAFARRALMAGTVHLQRLDNTLLKEQLLLCSTDLAETSLWQPAQCRDLKCHSFYCDSFFFMIMACGGEIIDVERGRGPALIWVRHSPHLYSPPAPPKKPGKQDAGDEFQETRAGCFCCRRVRHPAWSRVTVS